MPPNQVNMSLCTLCSKGADFSGLTSVPDIGLWEDQQENIGESVHLLAGKNQGFLSFLEMFPLTNDSTSSCWLRYTYCQSQCSTESHIMATRNVFFETVIDQSTQDFSIGLRFGAVQHGHRTTTRGTPNVVYRIPKKYSFYTSYFCNFGETFSVIISFIHCIDLFL